MPKSTKAMQQKHREFLAEGVETYFPPPPIGGPAPNTQRMSQLRRAMVNSRHGRENVAQFQTFLEQCTEEFEAADRLRQELERVLEAQSEGCDYIFGMGKESLDALVLEIQECPDWGQLQVGGADLEALDSKSAKRNRKRLRKWLLEKRPTEGLASFLGYVDKIRDEIEQILTNVQSGRVWVEKVYDDPEVAKEQGDMFVMRGGFSGPDVLRKLTQSAKKKAEAWVSFVEESTSKPAMESLVRVTLEDLMYWREQRVLKREAVQARIAAGVCVSEKRQVKEVSAPVAQRVYQRLARINEHDGVGVVMQPMSRTQLLREVEVEELKLQLQGLLCVGGALEGDAGGGR